MDEKHPVGMCRLVEKRSPLFPHPVGMRPWVPNLHESSHLLGLVSQNYLQGNPGKHNNNPKFVFPNPHLDSYAAFVMNDTNLSINRLKDNYYHQNLDKFFTVEFKELNKEYLKFILPTPTPGN